MANIYRVDFLDRTTGIKFAEVTNFQELALNLKVNSPGIVQIIMPGDHSVFAELEDFDIVEIYRKDPERGIDWTLECGGLFMYSENTITDDEPPMAIILVMEYTIYLNWRIIAYHAGVTNRSLFGNQPAETISKTLVDYNLGPNATDANRLITGGNQPGVYVETDLGGGNSLYISCAYRNLLEVLQEIAEIGGGDFNFVRQNTNQITFKWYAGQIGTDRRDDIFFSLARGNMRNPVYIRDHIDEKTIVLVAADGVGTDRYTRTRTSSDYSSVNHRELFVDARDLTELNANEMDNRGDARLREYLEIKTFTFEIAQVEGCLYGVDYFLGDLVKAENPFTGVAEDYKIVGVTLTFEPDGATETEIEVEKYG